MRACFAILEQSEENPESGILCEARGE